VMRKASHVCCMMCAVCRAYTRVHFNVSDVQRSHMYTSDA
jgi:hypothetical protein